MTIEDIADAARYNLDDDKFKQWITGARKVLDKAESTESKSKVCTNCKEPFYCGPESHWTKCERCGGTVKP